MNKLKSAIALTAVAFALVACGERAEVPPAHEGKILTKNGYAPESIKPSKFRLDACFTQCDKLILAQTGDQAFKENFRLLMPQDQLNMSFDIRLTASIRQDKRSINSIFDRITPAVKNENGTPTIALSQVYNTYGQPIVRDVVRATMAKYTINEVASSRTAVNQELTQAVITALENTPLTVRQFALADVQFPEVITRQMELNAEREQSIQAEEAQKQIELVRLETELEKAKLERSVRREKAEAAREENAIFAESVSKEYLQYRQLEVLEAMANNPNTVFVPFEALSTVGLNNKVMQVGR